MPLPHAPGHFCRSAPHLALTTLAALGLAAAHPAQAQTLNFNNFTAGSLANGNEYVGTTYATQGFTLASGVNFYALNGSGPFGDGETSLYSNGGGSTTLTQSNGKSFNFSAIDFGPDAGNSDALTYGGPVTLTGTQVGGGMVIATVNMNDPNGQFQKFTFTTFTNLLSLTFAGSGGSSRPQFDNAVLTPTPVPDASSAVSLGLMLALGLGGVAVLRRKQGQA